MSYTRSVYPFVQPEFQMTFVSVVFSPDLLRPEESPRTICSLEIVFTVGQLERCRTLSDDHLCEK